jgi:hypothetical protein
MMELGAVAFAIDEEEKQNFLDIFIAAENL